MGIQVDLSENRAKDFEKLEPNTEANTNNDASEINQEQTTQNTQTPQKDITDILQPINKTPEQKTDDSGKPTPPNTTENIELNDDRVSEYIKSKYFKDKEFEGLESFLKPKDPEVKEVEKIVNPFEDIMDDYDKNYFNFKKETGLGRSEFDFIQQDLSKKSPLEFSREKIRKDTGLQLTNEEADEYLASELGIDFDEELSTTDKIKLNAFAKPYKDEQLSLQEKYKTTIRETPQPKTNEDYVELNNGMRVTKKQFKELEQRHLAYQEDMKNAVNSVTALNFKIPIDNNGDKTELDISYDLSKEDKHSMLSDALDLDATVKRKFSTENGFNHSALAQTLFAGQNLEKIVQAVASQVRAATIEEYAANTNNENFEARPIQKTRTSDDGYAKLTGTDSPASGFGVKIKI